MPYTIEILGVDKTSLLKAGSLRVTRRTDKNNDCSITLETTAAGYLPVVGQDIKVKNSGTVIFGGCIKTITARKVEAGHGNTKKIELDISSDGYRSIPARRTITNGYNQRSAGYIVTDLVNNVFNTEGITAGTIGTGANPVGDSGEYDAICKNCAEILDDMAQASGYKWYIDDTKKLHFVADDTITAAAHDIVEGGAFTDYQIESYETTLDQYANKIFVRGGLGDDGNVIQTIAEDVTEQGNRKTVEGSTYSSGVYGAVINDTNIDLLADATTAAQNALKKSGIIPAALNITSYTLDWLPGTKLKVNLPTFGISTDTYYLIEELTLEDMDGKNLKCAMKASRRKELDFSTQSSQSGIDYLGSVVKKAKEGGKAGSSTYIDSSGNLTQSNLYVDTDWPPGAKSKSVLIDTDDFSRYDRIAISSNATTDVTQAEFVEVIGSTAITLTLSSTSASAGCIKKIKNSSSAIVTLSGTIDGSTTNIMYPLESVELIWNGTDWRVM
jgi:hypothetical protein